MKTVAIIALSCGMAAALAGIIIYSIRIAKTKVSDKWSVGIITFSALFLIIAVINLVLVVKFL